MRLVVDSHMSCATGARGLLQPRVWVPKVSWGCAAWLNFVLAGSDRLG